MALADDGRTAILDAGGNTLFIGSDNDITAWTVSLVNEQAARS